MKKFYSIILITLFLIPFQCDLIGQSFNHTKDQLTGFQPIEYDWGKRRIKKNYKPDSSLQAITIKNNESSDIRIIGYNVLSDIKGERFIFDRTIFNNLLIPANSQVNIPVSFYPLELGTYEFKIGLFCDNNDYFDITLIAVGMAPMLVTMNWDFGTTGVNNKSGKMKRKIIFFNSIFNADGITVTDSVTIFDFKADPSSMSRCDTEMYSPNSWYFDKSALKLPRILAPGDSIVFDAFFVPTETGRNSVAVSTVSSGLSEATSHWIGEGESVKSVDGDFLDPTIELQISPNPAGDYITISVGANGCSPESIKIFDIFGQEEHPPTPSYEEGELRVDVSALPPGVYFMRVGSKVSKFIKY